ncbi:response regulator transcription factor [Peribacillus frigoritolerans]|uniref:response regulator transcription factor n=1 Tax=Peribacillus frigoritolerans TaxID=450367 RepID=UPI00107093E5|nr:LuxR C-terminal-related transcriptional regulator [Peribacillus frigoritolerans]TFH61927.1 response regulator transcription factor [Peribacillus frigoritolerans]
MKNVKLGFNSVESRIIQLIASEVPNKQIALELNYSQRMVEYYISKISKKLEVHTRVGIVVKAFQNNILH